MNEIRTFRSDEFGNVRAVEIDGEPWFVAIDVCRSLGMSDTGKAVGRLDSDESTRIEIVHPQSVGKTIEVIAVNEPGLYSLVLGSRKKEAREFKRWITHEVIPSIRKTGGYSAGGANPFAAMIPKDYPSALRALADECEKNQKLENKIALDAPKVRFAECVADSPELAYVSQLAKVLKQNGIDIGRNRVFEWLRERGYIVKWATQNEPAQKAMNRELFYIVKGKDGSATPKLTQKGLIVLLNEIMDDYTGQNQMAII